MRVLRWRCRPFQSGFAFTRVQYQHSLASLVEQGKFDEATQEHARLRQLGQTIAFDSTFEEAATRILHSESKSATSFSQCLTFLPPASYPDDVPAPTLVRLLLRSPTQYMPFILELAPIASEKGYTHLYKNLLLPCIQKHASQHQYEHLINEVSGPSLDFHANSLDDNALYKTIERYLPEIAETSSLEDSSSDFLEQEERKASPPVSSMEPPSPTEVQIHSLILLDRYPEAFALLRDLRFAGFTVHLSRKFETPALAVLLDPVSVAEYDAHVPHVAISVREVFTFWLSFIPDFLADRRRTFTRLQRLLLDAPMMKLDLLRAFALLCTRKGYGHIIVERVLPALLLHDAPYQSWLTIQNFLRFHHEYWETAMPTLLGDDFDLAESRLKSDRAAALRVAITVFARRGEFKHAMSLFREYGLESVNLTAMRSLIHSLETAAKNRDLDAASSAQLREYLREVMEVFEQTSREQEVRRAWDSAAKRSTIAYRQLFPGWDGNLFPVVSGHDEEFDFMPLPKRLRILKSALRTGEESVALPHPFNIAQLMADCVASSRTKGLDLLRRQLFRTNHLGASHFLFAELLFYYRSGQYAAGVVAFARHFTLIGVPQDLVLRRLPRLQLILPTTGEIFLPLQTPPGIYWPKLSPHKYHISIFWHCFVRVTKGQQKLRHLYERLLSLCRHRSDKSGGHPRSKAQRLFPVEIIDSVFVPFIGPMSFYEGPKAGLRIIQDMRKLGRQPTVYHWTEILYSHARQADEEAVWSFFDRLDTGLDLDQITPTSPSPSPPSSDDELGPVRIPSPDVVLFTGTMRAFIQARKPEAALKVFQRLCKVMPYRIGVYPVLDQVVESIETLLKEEPTPKLDFGKRERDDQLGSDKKVSRLDPSHNQRLDENFEQSFTKATSIVVHP